MPAPQDAAPPARSGMQIFSLEDIHAISLLPPLPADAASNADGSSSLELDEDEPPLAPQPAVGANAPSVQPVAAPTLAPDASDAGGSPASARPSAARAGVEGERFPEPRAPQCSATRRPVVSHFSAEEIVALEGPPAQALALELPDDIWLHCLRFLDFQMQGRIPRLNRRFLALSACPEHWRNVASHCGYTQGGRPCGETESLSSGGWRDYCKQQRRRELSWLTPERCDMQAVRHSHQQWAPAIAYSPRTKEIVTCSYDGTVRMWLDDSGAGRNYPCTRVLTTEEGEGFSVVAIAPETAHVAPDSMLLAAGSEYGNVHVWQVDEDKSHRLALIPTNHDFVQSAVWTRNGRIVTGGETGTIQIHDLAAILPNGAQHGADEAVVAPVVVGQGAASGGAGHVALEGHSMAVMCMCASARGQLVSGSVDHTLRVWDLATAKHISTIQAHSRSVHCVCTHELDAGAPHGAGSELIFSGSRDHTIRVWDLRTTKPVAELHGHTGSVTCVGSYQWQLASGAGFNRGLDNDTVLSVDSTIRMWDLRTMQCMWVKEVPPPPGGTPHPKGDPVLCLQLLHDKILTSHGGKDWTARVWQISR